jgi:hypothetical protein
MKIEKILAKPNVICVGTGYKHVNGKATREICLIVGVTRKKKDLAKEDLIPSQVDNMRTDVIEIGIPRLVTSPVNIRSGDGIGPQSGGTGTVTCWVKDREDRDMIMSNYHVLGDTGKKVFYPNNKGIEIGQVWKHVPVQPVLQRRPEKKPQWFILNILSIIKFFGINILRKVRGIKDPQNYCDAAVALVTNNSAPDNYIPGIGDIKGVGQATVGERVYRRGITSGIQTGDVVAVNNRVTLLFNGRRCSFNNVILLNGRPADYGDSGSIVIDKNGLAVGMVFAAGLLTLCLPFHDALKALDVSLA